MRIAHIVGSLGAGGAETLTYQLVLEQHRIGHNVRVFTLLEQTGEEADGVVATERSRQLLAGGIPVLALSKGTRHPVRAGARLRRIWRTVGVPDVVHCHSSVALAAASIASNSPARVLTLHNTRVNYPGIVFRQLAKLADEIVAVSDPVADTFAALTGARPVVIPNGVVLYPEDPDERPLQAGKTRVIAIGSFTAQKNYPRMLKAFRLALDWSAGANEMSLTIVGDGPERRRIEAMLGQLGLRQEHVLLLGIRTDIEELLASSDVLLMSSDYEGLPMAMLEAMSRGVVPVTTPFPSSRKVLEDGRHGFTAEDFGASSLASALVEAISDLPRLAATSRSAHSRAADFGMVQCADAYLRLYLRSQRGLSQSGS